MRVRIPTPLRSYTGNSSTVEAQGDTVTAVLTDLDRQFPGFAFRIVDEQGRLRPHMNIFVDKTRTRDLDLDLAGVDELVIMQALSGG